MRLYALAKILVFAATLEVGTGLVLPIDPAVVVGLLLGAETSVKRPSLVDFLASLWLRWDWRAGRANSGRRVIHPRFGLC